MLKIQIAQNGTVLKTKFDVEYLSIAKFNELTTKLDAIGYEFMYVGVVK